MSTNYSSSLVPNCIQPASPTHQISNENQRNVNRSTPSNISPSNSKSNQQIKSPVAKRPPNSKVTLQGWLHKQGSDGLQLWRKRWFVLSELCLYYYKTADEEKLLGSVLLPSYRVSECRPEDKVVRKYAFKLEHLNMRTYLLAAESHKSMLQWLCALNLACMLQVPTTPITSAKSIQNDTKTSSQTYISSSNINNSSNSNNINNQLGQPQTVFQPLYENAPPKPRRVSDSTRGGYSESQQEYYPQKYSHIIYANHSPTQQSYPNQFNSHDSMSRSSYYPYQYPIMMPSPATHQTPSRMHPHIIERRTPDTYGRSPPHRHQSPVGLVAINKQISNTGADYEDVYNVNGDLYEPPRSPLAYNHVRNHCPNPQTIRHYQQQRASYRPLNMEPTYRHVMPSSHPCRTDNRRQPPPVREVISRPHSVDFLEHKNSSPDEYHHRQPERPKSSLDINKRSEYNENDFYSEQDYANKMRQSAMYLHLNRSIQPNPRSLNNSLDQRNKRYPVDDLIGLYERPQQQLLNQSVERPTYLPTNMYRDQHHASIGENLNRGDSYDPVYRNSLQHRTSGNHEIRSRSKSPQIRARYPVNQESNVSPSVETEKKREESMKRLIEWKQRMLQSPLNHKQMSRRQQMRYEDSNSPSNEHRLNTIATSTPASAVTNRYHRPPPPPSNLQNTSYSSDDEDTEHSESVDVTIQAGRTHQVSTSLTNGDKDVTVSVSATSDSEKTISNKDDNELFPLVTVSSSDDVFTATSSETIEPPSKLEQAETPQMSIESSEDSKDLKSTEQHYMIMVPKKSILAPSRSAALFESLSCESEESSYVEMMRGLGGSSLLESNTCTNSSNIEAYETVCFTGEKSEPVYMELGQNKDSNLFSPSTNSYHTLPDILISSEKQKSSKSDSSDADDEASKDFNSLDAPTQPRFSLSDTFRPASYYLGVNRVLAEFQDSSDSELVSPPPIPDASALLDDLDTCIANDDKKLDFVTFREKNQTNELNKNNGQHIRSFSAIDSYTNKEFDIKADMLNKRRPVSSDFCSKLDTFTTTNTLNNLRSTSRESIYTPMMSYEEEHEYENICLFKSKINEHLNSSSNTLTSSASESTFVAKDLLNESSLSHRLSESPCSSNFINSSSFDTSSSNRSIQFSNRNKLCQLIDKTTNDEEKSNLNETNCMRIEYDNPNSENSRIISQLSKDYYLLELLRSSGTSDSSTSIKNLSLNNDTDSKLDQQVRKADMFQIALAAKSHDASPIDIMKFGKINNKNLYHHDESSKMNNIEPSGSDYSDEKNWKKDNWPEMDVSSKNIDSNSEDIVRRSHSLEGILQNVLKETSPINVVNLNESANLNQDGGDHLWEEDCLWQENLRRASHRHARSLDDLQSVNTSIQQKKLVSVNQQNRAIKLTRGVTYVNDCVTKERDKFNKDKDDEYVHLIVDRTRYSHPPTTMSSNSTNTNDRSFIIDREKLRQWDLMSSAPVLTRTQTNFATTTNAPLVNNTNINNSNPVSLEPLPIGDVATTSVGGFGEKVADIEHDEKVHYDKNSASGSVSIVSGHDSQSLDHSQWSLPDQNRQLPNLRTTNANYPHQYYDNSDRYNYRSGSLPRSATHTLKRRPNYFPKNLQETCSNKGLKLSAGELLGRTHEELVLLLIQLRRQSISTYQAIEACTNEIDLLKSTIAQDDNNRKLENLQRLEQLQLQLIDLGKRYEKNKPLVNLVDNMVKLGSLYQRNGSRSDKLNAIRNRERLQFNQHVQERRLLAEERRDWEKLNLNHAQLQVKIQQLYELDNALRHESGTLAGLRKEKEYLEGALQALQSRLTDPELPSTPPAELDRVRRHQQMLERELSRVHVLLAYNSKKLEETVAGNARIEQELLVLRQKLQMTQNQRNQSYMSNTLPKDRKSLAESVPEMESELKRVQWLMGDLQKQRQELSVQVRHLTDKSQNLAHQIQWTSAVSADNLTSTSNSTNDLLERSASQQQFSSRSTSQSPNTTFKHSSWLETDLDQNQSISNNSSVDYYKPTNYRTSSTSPQQQLQRSNPVTCGNQSDDSSVGLISTDTSDTQQSCYLHDKQEIKTVRIVKRESERRHRDRERSGSSLSLATSTQCRFNATNTSSASLDSLKRNNTETELSSYKSEDIDLSVGVQSHPLSKSSDSLSTYKNSKQIISPGRRTIPKEKRRHHTAPDNNLISRELSLISGTSDGDTNSWIKSDRSLDDLDMERALRPRINTPDVVRSTLGHKEIKYNERTIDNILGTPSKIIIPERYMPQDLPELSAEEERQRKRKVESIKKMLSDSTALPTTVDTSRGGSAGVEGRSYTMSEEKRQREHLLQLNQILAKQVIEMSKIVAEKALNSLPQLSQGSTEEDELSPITPLPLYQQRENYFS